jgi:hypothetical protein
MLNLILNFITLQHLNVLTYVSCHDLLLGWDWTFAAPGCIEQQRKDPAVDSGNVMSEKWPRKKNVCTPPRIDFAVTLFSLIIMNLCLDVRLCWKVVDLFCFIVMNLCLDGTLWWKIATLWWRRFIVMNLCLDASSDCVIVSTCYVWSYECVNLFWLRLVTPGVSATPGVSNQSCHSVWCDWHHESRQTVWCN